MKYRAYQHKWQKWMGMKRAARRDAVWRVSRKNVTRNSRDAKKSTNWLADWMVDGDYRPMCHLSQQRRRKSPQSKAR